MRTPGGTVLAALLVAAAVGAGCSSDDGGVAAPEPPSCRLPDDLSRTAVLLDVDDGPEYTLVTADLDARTVSVVCEGLGGAVRDLEPPLALGAEPYRSVQGAAEANSAWSPVSADLRYAVAGDDLIDLRTGQRTRATRSRWAPAYPSSTGAIVLVNRATTSGERLYDPSSWCLLPRADAPVEECAPVPGASGEGTPVVAADGTVGWAPTPGVPLRAGPIEGAATGAAGRLAAAEPLPPDRAARDTTNLWLDPAGTSALVEPSTVDDVIDRDEEAPVAWLTDLTVGPDGVSGRFVQSSVDYEAVSAATAPEGLSSAYPVVDGYAPDGPDGVVLLVRESRGGSLVRVRADSAELELLWDDRTEGSRLPSARLLRVPGAGGPAV